MLAGVVVGGLNRPLAATLGGFSIGFATGLSRRHAPVDEQRQYLTTVVYGA